MKLVSIAVIAGLVGSAFAQDCMWAPRGQTIAPFSPVPVYHSGLGSIILVTGNGVVQQWIGSGWTQIAAAAFTGRYNASVCYDSVRNRVVLFGGSNSFSTVAYGETWEWDGATWSRAALLGAVQRPALRLMAFDEVGGRCVLIDSAENSAHMETWQWNGVAWSLVPGTTPPPRVGFGLAYDQGRQRITLYGGTASTHPQSQLRDVWELSNSDWTQRADGPPGLHKPALGYDPARARLVIQGGPGYPFPPETWEHNPETETWSRQAIGGPEFLSQVFAFDALTQRGFVLSNNKVWEWNPIGTVSPTIIIEHPLWQEAPLGGRAEFTVVPGGSGPFSFRWRRAGVPISNGNGVSGADTSRLVIEPVALSHLGEYQAEVGNGCFPVLSNPARLFAASDCYPNCDGSTLNPVLTPSDFMCFLGRFASHDPRANCDGSTNSPLFTANDFQCFMNKFAAGCP